MLFCVIICGDIKMAENQCLLMVFLSFVHNSGSKPGKKEKYCIA